MVRMGRSYRGRPVGVVSLRDDDALEGEVG